MAQRLSVLITYHNERVMLQQCLRSLADQSVWPDEVIVYDDFSKHAAEDYLLPGFPAKVIRGLTNKGPSAGRNRLLEASSSEYIHFHDADDLFRPNWCESVRNRISAGNVDVVLNDISLCSHGTVIQERFYNFGARPEFSDFLRLAIRQTLVPSTGTYRRSAVYQAGRYDARRLYSEDYDFHLRLALSGVRCAFIQEPLILQRLHGDNRSWEKTRYWAAGVDILSRMLHRIPCRYHPFVSEAALVFASDLERVGRKRDAQAAFELSKRAGMQVTGCAPHAGAEETAKGGVVLLEETA